MAVLFARDLGAVPDQEAGVTGEFVLRLRDDLDDEFLGDKFPARDDGVVYRIGPVQFTDDAALVWASRTGSRTIKCMYLVDTRVSGRRSPRFGCERISAAVIDYLQTGL